MGDRAVSRPPKLRVQVCQHTTCLKDGSAAVLRAFEAQQPADVEVVAAGCMGNCGNGPTVRVLPDQQQYSRVRSQDIHSITAPHLNSGQRAAQSSQAEVSQSKGAGRSRGVAIGVLGLAVLFIIASLGWTFYSLL